MIMWNLEKNRGKKNIRVYATRLERYSLVAFSALQQNPEYHTSSANFTDDVIGQLAVERADALIRQLDKMVNQKIKDFDSS